VSRIFGGIRQNGYVVPDIEAALAHWTQVLGVGPFYYFERVPIENFHYRGEPSELEASIALSNSGPLQIELIQQRNDAPSMYRDFLERIPAGGLQHVAYWTGTFDKEVAKIKKAGFAIGQSGQIGHDGRFVYLDTEANPGTVVEVSETNGPKGAFFERLAEKAANWDGRDPILRR